MRADTCLSTDVAVQTGSSSGLAVVSRRDLGRHRHVSTRYVCVQQRVREGRLGFKKSLATRTSATHSPSRWMKDA